LKYFIPEKGGGMIRVRRKGQPVFIFMLLVALSIALPYHYAVAALVPTDSVADSAGGADTRGRLMHYLARQDVRAALAAQGLDPEEAQARVACLTDAEVRQITGQLDRLPAGGDGLGIIIAVLVIVLLVILILKVAGKLK
jgi:hypothetical protein